jgi:anionic cell wall polymer biosynthesis LytR-Cps2A-Psr (LCP) family protein
MKAGNRLLVRLIQASAVLLVAGLCMAAVALGWVAYELRGLSDDISQSQARLPAPVRAALPVDAGILEHPQVTLVRYSSGISAGAAVLFSTVPARHQAAFLTLPPSTQVNGSPLDDLNTQKAIAALGAERIPVDHVALIDPARVGPLVDGLGGITVDNKTTFVALTPDGRQLRFHPGKLGLDGNRAKAYIEAATTREQLEKASEAVLAGIVHKVLAPAGFQRMQTIGNVLAHSAATDLTDEDVVGLAELRLRGGATLQCQVPRHTRIADERATLDQFLGKATNPGAPCGVHHVDSARLAPPLTVVRLVQHYGWHLFAAAALLLMLLATIATVALVVRWPKVDRTPPRGVLPPPLRHLGP